ncbi:MAG: hypothetical protein EOP06_28330, partial [Proteobacteria bacterium]
MQEPINTSLALSDRLTGLALTVITVLFWLPVQVRAANTCESFFQNEAAFSSPSFAFHLDPQKFRLETKQEHSPPTLFQNTEKYGWVELGTVRERQVEYLFQWSGLKRHRKWLNERLITQESMDKLLQRSGQALGKGFYVSTHPVDSRVFGAELNVFTISKPVVILESADPREFARTQATVDELRAIGIDMVGSYRYPNWYAVISERPLDKIQEIDEAAFKYIAQHFSDEYNLPRQEQEDNFATIFAEKHSTFLKSKFAKQVSKKVLSGQSLNTTEAALLIGM